jgi:Tol biopolymer transport system component
LSPRILIFRCSIALALAAAGCATAPVPHSPPRIVFSSERSGGGDIYMARIDGSELRRLTHDSLAERLPRCSPDRRQLLFVRGEGAAAELVLLDLASGAERYLTRDEARDSTPEWSIDGAHVYFTRRDGAHDRLAVIAADGSGLRFLTPAGVHNVMPAVSPDGASLVHHSYAFGRETELQLLDLASGAFTRLTDAPGADYEASFAGPDRLVFSSNRGGGHYRLYRQDAGKDAQLLADTGMDSWTARFSPAHRLVLFHTGKPGAWRSMALPIDGGTPAPILDDGESNSTPDWC